MDATWQSLEERARAVLPDAVLEYLLQGARDSVTAGEAVAAWGDLRFRPRVLHDVTHVDLGVTLLGHTAEVPCGVAPTTLQRSVHPEGEIAMARAAAAAGSVLVVSSNAGTPFADIAETGVHWWLQVYLPADRTLAEPLLERAVEAGAARCRPHRRHPGGRHQVRHAPAPTSSGTTVDPGAAAGELRARLREPARRREGARPRTARHRLARRPQPACRSW